MSEDKKIFYVCGVDWQHELGETKVMTYASVDQLKKEMKCTEECGIVELEAALVKWIMPQKIGGE